MIVSYVKMKIFFFFLLSSGDKFCENKICCDKYTIVRREYFFIENEMWINFVLRSENEENEGKN